MDFTQNLGLTLQLLSNNSATNESGKSYRYMAVR